MSGCTQAVGPEKQLIEFGLRRAQGPDGAMSASKYSYLGGQCVVLSAIKMRLHLSCRVL